VEGTTNATKKLPGDSEDSRPESRLGHCSPPGTQHEFSNRMKGPVPKTSVPWNFDSAMLIDFPVLFLVRGKQEKKEQANQLREREGGREGDGHTWVLFASLRFHEDPELHILCRYRKSGRPNRTAHFVFFVGIQCQTHKHAQAPLRHAFPSPPPSVLPFLTHHRVWWDTAAR